MNNLEFKEKSFQILSKIANIYYENDELSKYFDLWITESTENGADQISLTIKEREI